MLFNKKEKNKQESKAVQFVEKWIGTKEDYYSTRLSEYQKKSVKNAKIVKWIVVIFVLLATILNIVSYLYF